MVYLALTLMVFLALAGLAIDGSNTFYRSRVIQTAADAAALAAARAIALNQDMTQVAAEVQTLSATNGADQVTWSYINGNTGVHVDVENTSDTYFVCQAVWLQYPDGACRSRGRL